MKLHLPTVLFALAVLPAVAFAEEKYVVTTPANVEVIDASTGAIRIDVGHPDTHNPFGQDGRFEKYPSQIVKHQGNLILGADSQVGVFDNDGNGGKVFKELKDYDVYEQSNTLYVTGDVNVKSGAQVQLGGQGYYQYVNNKGVLVTAATAYNVGGMEVEGKVTVEGGIVDLGSAKLGSLSISGGTVNIGTDENKLSGNGTSTYGYGEYVDSSWDGFVFIGATITGGVTVTDGTLAIGNKPNSNGMETYPSSNDGYFQSVIDGAIEQFGGKIVLHAKNYIKSDSITQYGGEMTLSERYSATQQADKLRFEDEVVNIKQTGGTMNLNGIIIRGDSGAEKMQLNIEQSGDGTINMVTGKEQLGKATWSANYVGSKFITGDGPASTIKQSGSGTININSDYTSATFNVEQTGTGTITIGKHGVLKSSALTLTDAATFSVVNGGQLILEDATLSYTVTKSGSITSSADAAVYADGAVVSMSDEALLGSVTGKIVSAGVVLSDEVFADAFTIDVGALAEGTTSLGIFSVTLATGLKGTVTFDPAEAGFTTEATYTVGRESVTVAYNVKDVNVVNGNLVATVGATVTAVGGSTPAIPEPATATLSLLALAGLCARRRRK